MIQPNDQREGKANSPSWGVLGPIPPILSILLAGATASAGSYIATRERLIIAEQRVEALQHQVADLKSDIADLRRLVDNRLYPPTKAILRLPPFPTPPTLHLPSLLHHQPKKVTVTPFHLGMIGVD